MASIKKILPIVVKALEKWPETRDSDYRLYYAVALHLDKNLMEISAHKLLQEMESGKLPSWETVGRCRRKCQEDREDLRGDRWTARHSEEDDVKEQLGYRVEK